MSRSTAPKSVAWARVSPNEEGSFRAFKDKWSAVMRLPSLRMTARSRALRNSLTLPGQ